MDLKLAHHFTTEDELYLHQLQAFLLKKSPKLIECDSWNKQFVLSHINNKIVEFSYKNVINFSALPPLPKAEFKVYWVNLLDNKTNHSWSIIENRLVIMNYLNSQCKQILSTFNVSCIANIPFPEFPVDGFTKSVGKQGYSDKLIRMYKNWRVSSNKNVKNTDYNVNYPSAQKIVSKKYTNPRVTILGSIHKQIIIQKEQFKPLNKRNIILLKDLYDNNETRFKENQKLFNNYLNFYRYPVWMRDAVKYHVLEKVENGELAASTLINYYGRFLHFRNFLYEKFESPSPKIITNTLVQDDFIAWGNKNKLTGKNWYTDTIAILTTASRLWPEKWPSLSLSYRTARKIENVHYKTGLGRVNYNQEGAGRSYSKRIIDEIASHIDETPHPIPLIYAVILSTGMRAEDGHALLYDCLSDDPSDEKFMLLSFWQNKVRKWNTKPLLKDSPEHAYLIKLIKNQQEYVKKKYRKETKHLFPSFKGQTEYFISHAWTNKEIKQLCIKHNILNDEGEILNFSWHPLRHSKGTSMAEDGHDILTIMMELGHTSPDMATVYVNKRLSLKKKALIEKGNGHFYTIEGKVDEKVGELLLRKNDLVATRVCGGACILPNQLGDWCSHANACFNCKYFRADEKDIDYFKVEMQAIITLIDEQKNEIIEHEESGRKRMSQIIQRRTNENKNTAEKLNNIIQAIETQGQYQGNKPQLLKLDLE